MCIRDSPYTHRKDFPPMGRYWAFSKETLQRYISDGKIKFKKNYREKERGFIFKRYKKEMCIRDRYESINQGKTWKN